MVLQEMGICDAPLYRLVAPELAESSSMKHEVPHVLGQQKAKQVAIQALGSYQQRFAEYQPRVDWASESLAKIGFSVKGIKLSGSIEVLANSFSLDLDVPFLLKPFRGKALAVIEDEINKWIAKA
jgi:hypothetical protein